MGLTVEEIEEMFDRGVEQGATHLIVVCDTFKDEYYPIFVRPDQDVREAEKRFATREMSEVMEVYNLSMSKTEQTRTHDHVRNY